MNTKVGLFLRGTVISLGFCMFAIYYFAQSWPRPHIFWPLFFGALGVVVLARTVAKPFDTATLDEVRQLYFGGVEPNSTRARLWSRLGWTFFLLSALGMWPVYVLPVTRDLAKGYSIATSASFVLCLVSFLIALGWFIAGRVRARRVLSSSH